MCAGRGGGIQDPQYRILFSISRCIFRARGSASCMDLREVFATNLRRLRHDRALSQDDLAYEAGVSRSYLSQLEKGVFHASLKIVGRLAEALNAEPAEFLRMTQAPSASESGRTADSGEPKS